MSKLEKFKRRLIRSVAMLLIQEKKPEEEVWGILKEEIGKNCNVLWSRMRALTVKKLNRLLAAEDRTDIIPKFAQMSDTDWLFFDMIIAHEDEDVIGREELCEEKSNTKVLGDLFTLVQKFNIEELQSDRLAEAWNAATISYNSTGHRCSPMLMQRRWYQLKKCTRQRFYDFWFSYRGVLRHLDDAQRSKPNELQQAIATKYPHIVTAPFQSWEEMIKRRLVILPEEFEKYKSKTFLPKPCEENSPDLLLLEPVIETIDLEEYISDDEKIEDDIPKGLANVEESISSCKVKMEPEDIPNDSEFEGSKSNISMEVMSSLVQEETLLGMNDDMNKIDSKEMNQKSVNVYDEIPTVDIINEEKNIKHTPIQGGIPIAVNDTISEMASITPTNSVQENISETITESFEEGIPKITNVFGNVDITNEALINSLTQNKNILKEKPELNVMPVSISEKDCETINLDDSSDTDDVQLNEELSVPSQVNTEDADIKNLPPSPTPSPIKDLSVSQTSDENHVNEEIVKTKQSMFGGLRNYFDFKEEGIELVDDGIEYVEDDELEEKIDCHTSNKVENEDNEDLSESEEGKFDLKLLMHTVVYTRKLDDMKVLKDKDFNSINSQSLIDSITIESKPVSSESLDIPNCAGSDNTVIDDILADNDNNKVDDLERVDLSSSLLKKPKYRAYNPIKLCKNPDFNTRLKRLTVGFLSSSRNRFLLKLCKPMTIDMSRAFESKLINGTMYLNNSITATDTKNDGNHSKPTSVIPSAISVRSLIDNMILQTLVPGGRNNEPQLVCSFDGSLAATNKIFDLPDMNKVPITNHHFLTENVTPIQVQNFDHHRPGDIINPNYSITNDVPVVKQVDCISVELDSKPIILDSCAQLLKESLAVNNVKVLSNTPEILDDNNVKVLSNTPEILVENNVEVLSNTPEILVENNVKVLSNTPEILVENNVEVLSNTTTLVINDKTTDNRRTKTPDPCNLNINRHFNTNNPNSVSSDNCISPQSEIINKKTKKKFLLSTYKQTSWRCTSNTEKVSWIKDIKYTKEDDALITIDTLHKMLSHINNVYDTTAPVKNKSANKKQKKMKKNETLQTKPKETINNDALLKTKEKNTKETKPVDNSIKTPIVTVVYEKHKKKYNAKECCWARTQINAKKNKTRQYYKHTCKRYQCTCCCDDELRNFLRNLRALKSACDSIESVVQQTRELIAVQTTETIKPITETVVTQTHVDLSEDPSDNEMSDTIKLKEVSSTVSNDLNKAPSIDYVQRNDENINIQEIHTPISMEVTENRSTSETETENQLLPQFTPLANSKITDHEIEDLQSVQTIQISADATGPDCNDTSKHSKQRISIYDTSYSRKCMNPLNQQHNKQNKDDVPTDDIQMNYTNNHINSKEKIVILNRRLSTPSTIQKPIYLGKNKILLTNVKIPSSVINQTRNILEGKQLEMAIPKGVQLVLSPSGELVCNLLPGAEIDTNSLTQLPSIMASVQKHLNLTGGALQLQDANPIINISGKTSEKGLDVCEVESELIEEGVIENSQFVSSEFIVEGVRSSSDKTNIEYDPSIKVAQSIEDGVLAISTNNKETVLDHNIEDSEQNEIDLVSQSTTLSGENVQPLPKDDHNESSKTKKDTVENIENAEESSVKIIDDTDTLSTSRKTLLSDLMEMSGISAEDVAPIENTQHIVEVPRLIPLGAQPITVHDPDSNLLISDNYSSIQSNVRVPIIDADGKNQIVSLPQLNTISSYNELKYAFKNNGSFFKLDYRTGTIVPISVCIKKTARLSGIDSESVIDLTDEKDDVSENQKDEIEPNKTSKKRLILKAVEAKPLKVFRAVHGTDIKCKDSSGLLKIRIKKQNTNSLLKTNFGVVNSDNIREQTCVISSSDDESKQRKRACSSDSSDDEPLISIVKRKKMNIENKKMNTENNSTEIAIGVEVMNEKINKIGEHSTEAIPAEVELLTELPEVINEDTVMPTALSIVLDHTEAEEDCILGV